MSIKINYKSSDLKKPSNNLVLFSDDKFSLKPLKKYITNQALSEYNNSNKLGIKLAKKMLLDGGDEILSEVRR